MSTTGPSSPAPTVALAANAIPAAAAPSNLATHIQNAVEEDVKKALKALNIGIPQDLQKQITDSAAEAAKRRTMTVVGELAQQHASAALAGVRDMKNSLSGMSKIAMDTLATLSADKQYQSAIEESAKLMKARYDAYTKVGFSAEQAFELLVRSK